MIQPGQYNITIQRHGDFDITFQLKDSNGVGVDLAGSTIESQLWTAGRRAKIDDFTVTIVDEAIGKFTVSLTEVQTIDIPDICYYDVLVTDSLGKSYYWVRGTVTVDMGYTE